MGTHKNSYVGTWVPTKILMWVPGYFPKEWVWVPGYHFLYPFNPLISIAIIHRVKKKNAPNFEEELFQIYL